MIQKSNLKEKKKESVEGTSRSTKLSLSDLLPPERIRLNVSASSWQEAIRKAGSLLLETGSITKDFINAMIQTAEELGPY
ncbi:MAG: PTS sugar transporter subunit IIA, partial [Anaerolineaceae bacterium]|nr:PTS sugar transporter subunit IIA [Anaerolineaceae bacterium]